VIRGSVVASRPSVKVIASCVVFVLVGSIPLALGSNYLTTIVAQAIVLIVAVLGFNLVMGEAGLFSLAAASFLGIGAYGYAILLNAGYPAILDVVAAVLMAMIVAVCVGLLTLRLRLAYFAIATFAVSQIIANLAGSLSITGGYEGLAVQPFVIGGISITGPNEGYPLLLAMGALALLVHQIIRASKLGREMRCIRDDEVAAGAIGIPPTRVKLTAFVIGAAFSALAGCLYALTLPYLDPSIVGADQGVLILIMLIVGGAGTALGAVVGAVVISLVPQLLQPLQNWWEVIYGGVVILSVSIGRNGLAGLAIDGWKSLSRHTALASYRGVSGGAGSFTLPSDYPSPGITSDLEIHQITKRFGGVVALAGVDCRVVAGTIHAVIGPNGSGKSTLVNVITGIYRPDGGDVRLGDRTITGMPPHRIASAGIARTFQSPRPFISATVIENLIPALQVAGKHGTDAVEDSWALLDMVGLTSIGHREVGELPHGQLRLLEVARSIAAKPVILVLDEPAAGLTHQETEHLGDLLRHFCSSGRAVLLIEHNMPFVLGLADRVTVLDYGRRIAEGTPREISTSLAVQEAYLGSSFVDAHNA
jgi:branched-chain amino acid transport system permease protein